MKIALIGIHGVQLTQHRLLALKKHVQIMETESLHLQVKLVHLGCLDVMLIQQMMVAFL